MLNIKIKNKIHKPLKFNIIKTRFTVRGKEIFRLNRNPETYEVFVNSYISLEDYRKETQNLDWLLLEKWAKPMIGKSVIFINPTMEGGGVAIMRPPLVHLLKLLGVDAHWYVMEGKKNPTSPNPFIFTKLMHNILQRRSGPGERINEIGKSIHRQWNKENADVLTKQQNIIEADIIFLDDPQPAPLKSYITKVNKNAKIVWRSHIDTDNRLMSDPSTPQGEVTSYLLDELGIRGVDAVISHPVNRFIYPKMNEKTFFAPATVEPRDDLNRSLNNREITAGIAFINHEISKQNKKFSALDRLDDVQSKINPKRRQLVLIARFDEAKGMDKALAIGVLTRERMRQIGVSEYQLPQIIIVGNGSIDDPSGIPMYETMLKIRREHYESDKKDIIIMRLKHNYLAINALMSRPRELKKRNYLQIVALQTSEAEGCETRISDWIRHGIPVVVSNRGGMPLQVVEGKSGIVLDYDKPDFDIERATLYISEMMTNQAKYDSLAKSTMKVADKYNNREFTTTANATRLLRVFCKIIGGHKADKIWEISEMVDSQK